MSIPRSSLRCRPAVSRAHDPELQAATEQPQRSRTPQLIAEEIQLRRRERDEHLANQRVRLAGECCSDLEQLSRELVGSQR
jgi:hypothetical protein